MKRTLCAALLGALTLLPGLPALAQAPAPRAGQITRLVPVDYVIRQKKTLEAKKDMEVLWGDTIRTDRGGRVRVQLEDGSILNVGSESSLVIEHHDPATQQTTLDLAYGRVRANAVKISRPEGGFKVKTRSAVAGIVGTEEFLESSELATTVIALGGGKVVVTSTDPRYPDPVTLDPGEAVTMVVAQRPGEKRLATAEEIGRAISETESDPVATLNPRETLPGRTFQATINGKGLNTATGITTSQPGVSVQTRGDASATQIPVTITVAPDVPTGTYQVVVERPEGPARATLIVTTQEAIQAAQPGAGGTISLPSSFDVSGTRGTKFALDASSAQAPSGTQIVSYQWQVVNTSISSTSSTFNVNTSLLPPGNYTIQLVVVNDKGQTATQKYTLTVAAGLQPAEIVREIAIAYESLQPSQFLRRFDEEKFRNFSGFAAAIEDSFRSQLETMRVFQRPVNCAVLEEQDQAVCQADFELQFTKKDQPTELLDAQGNPVPPGVPPPEGSTLGKRILTGSERTTIRFERGDQGWKVVDYAAVVSCPGGASTTGVNVGSCVLALGSTSSPSFLISNLQVLTTDLLFGSSVSGSFEVVPVAGFTGSVQFTGAGTVGDQSVTVQFSPNPSGPSGTVQFTVFSPTTAPTGLSGPQPFTVNITGMDTSRGIAVTASLSLVLQPNFSLTVSPVSTSSSPIPATHNSTIPLGIQVVPGPGFTGTVLIDFPNLPVGFSATSGTVEAGSTTTFPLAVSSAAAPGLAQITVLARFGASIVRTASVFVNVTSDFTLSVTPVTSSGQPQPIGPAAPLSLSVSVIPISGFAGTVTVDFPSPPPGITVTPPTATIAAGSRSNFTVQTGSGATAGPAQLTVRGTFTGSIQVAVVFLQILTSVPLTEAAIAGGNASGFAMISDPPTASSAPLLLGDSASAFAHVRITASEQFSGPVELSVAGLPEGVTATVEPSVVQLAAGAIETVRVEFRSDNASKAIPSSEVRIRATSAGSTVETSVFLGAAVKQSDAPRISAVRAPAGQPGTYVPVIVTGESLGGVTGVVSETPALSAVLEPYGTATRIQLTVFVRPDAESGAYRLLLTGVNGSAAIPFQVVSDDGERRLSERRAVAGRVRMDGENARPGAVMRRAIEPEPDVQRDSAPMHDAAGQIDLVVDAADFTMTPANPKPGETVTFRVRVRNEGAQAVDNATLEFTIAGTSIRQREQVSLESRGSQTFYFEWRAEGSGRLEPRVAVDPEKQIADANRVNNTASLPPLEFTSAGGNAVTGFAPRMERARLAVAPGGCIGFRIASGTETPCGSGADFELRAAADSGAVTLHAEGVRNLGGVSLETISAPSLDGGSLAETVQVGSVYVVETARGTAAVRIAQVRGAGSGTPAALRGPRLAGTDREVRSASPRGIQVWIEWKTLSSR